eukprot:TRINITY_DN25_c1_g4_i1.p2 TRINITY_DN25_c1_g4~~TRINITY_DN25_c1_g4_i1.p2  ORF type:complete len:131 (+),score=30.75 TRINITY_DN25_c1_g4_i1:62-454(+)
MARDEGSTVRPCDHNDWDDVRTRSGFKVLRCRICQGRWKLLNRSVNRCMAFLHNCCDDTGCGMLHVRRKKCTVMERYDRFGDSVLKGVAPKIKRQAKRYALRRPPPLLDSNSDSEDDQGPPALLDDFECF